MEPMNTMEATTEVMQETAMPKGNWMLRCGDFILRNTGNICAVMMAAAMIGRVALAAPDGGADEMWNTLTDLITKWVARLGGVVVFIGLIIFALGWKSEDAEQKTRGMQTVIAGVMVAAIAGSANLFMNYSVGGGGEG